MTSPSEWNQVDTSEDIRHAAPPAEIATEDMAADAEVWQAITQAKGGGQPVYLTEGGQRIAAITSVAQAAR